MNKICQHNLTVRVFSVDTDTLPINSHLTAKRYEFIEHFENNKNRTFYWQYIFKTSKQQQKKEEKKQVTKNIYIKFVTS